MKIEIEKITQSKFRRPLDAGKVDEIVESIRTVGLINPITLSPDNKLIAGAHRLEAARKLGWSEIDFTVLDTNELAAELAEIDENLIRNELDMVTIGELAVRRDEILSELGQRAMSGTNLKNSGTGVDSAPVKTTATIANEMGMSERN
ncbi:MAG: ParB N-terminal domain-containing protein [Thermoguttaceae bacterium]